MGEYNQALGYFNQILGRGDHNIYALNELGITYREMGKYDQALGYFNRILKYQRHNVYALNGLGSTYRKMGEHDLAIDTLKPAANQGHIQSINELGITYREKGKYDQAIGCFKQILQQDAHSVHALNELGITYREMGRYDDAIVVLKDAVSRDNKASLNELGITYREMREYDRAIAVLKDAVSQDNVASLNELGITYREMREYAQAIDVLKDAVDRRNVISLNELGTTYLVMKEYDQAIMWFERALEQNPRDVYAWDGLGNVYSRLKQAEKAIECYHKVLEFEADYAPGLIKIGEAWEEQSLWDRAKAYYEVAMRTDQENEALKRQIAIVEQKSKEATAQLMRLRELASLSSLTTGLAHEIRNPLSVIQFAAQNLLEMPDADAEFRRRQLARIQENADRIYVRLEQARALAESETTGKQKVAVLEVLSRALEMFQQQLQIHHIQVDLRLPGNLPTLYANPVQLEQIFVNLISNAKDALAPTGGVITISAEFDASTMILRFADDGPGIAPEHQSHIFEPLFTTKKQGTGVGLWLCKDIVHQMGGEIVFETVLGKGTTFIIILPLVQEE